MESHRLFVGKASGLANGQSIKFRFLTDGVEREGFVLRHGDVLYAYRNECRHIPMTMDWVDNRFLSRDGRYIQCATHGALFRIETGECVAGPPVGERLHCMNVEIVDDDIVVTVRV